MEQLETSLLMTEEANNTKQLNMEDWPIMKLAGKNIKIISEEHNHELIGVLHYLLLEETDLKVKLKATKGKWEMLIRRDIINVNEFATITGIVYQVPINEKSKEFLNRRYRFRQQY